MGPSADGPVEFMTLDEIKALIDVMRASDLVEMEVSKDGWTLRMTRGPGSSSSAPLLQSDTLVSASVHAGSTTHGCEPLPAFEAPSPTNNVKAPLSGIVYLNPSPDAPPFVVVGQAVAKGTTLCTIEAMKMFNSVAAERDGVVEAILVSSGEEVAAGQPLFRVV
jgi:acetyl-CoA carboxylase biotin carboxyl carrier protein